KLERWSSGSPVCTLARWRRFAGRMWARQLGEPSYWCDSVSGTPLSRLTSSLRRNSVPCIDELLLKLKFVRTREIGFLNWANCSRLAGLTVNMPKSWTNCILGCAQQVRIENSDVGWGV